MHLSRLALLGALGVTALTGGPVLAQDNASDLAKKLSNPISSLISVPFQLNYDSGYGTTDASRTVLNIQPVIPFSIGEDWNMISRTIMPVISQDAFTEGGSSASGLGDITQSLFFSPKQATEGGVTWGVGPVFLLPTASDDALGGGKWGIGPTGVVLRQTGPWTYGVLANHIWSVAGDSDRDDVNATYLQPFLTYVTARKTTFGLNSEASYNWETDEWAVPINLSVSQLVKLGGRPVQLTADVRYWAESPQGGPQDWGARLAVTYLFPK